MVVKSGAEAVGNANRYKTNRPGMCLQYVRTWLEIPAGNPSAIAAWNSAKRKHINGRDKDAQSPPRGAPVFWGGGQYGHIALAVSNNFGRSTDTTRTGQVSTQNGDWWRVNWHKPYLGWTEDLNGVDIPYLKGGGQDQWASGVVFVAKLKAGQRNSDSVARLRYVLLRNNKIPAKSKPGKSGDDFGPKMVKALAYWQTNVRPKADGPKDGKSMSNAQANLIFGKRYDVREK